jgi:hypothetical protein
MIVLQTFVSGGERNVASAVMLLVTDGLSPLLADKPIKRERGNKVKFKN